MLKLTKIFLLLKFHEYRSSVKKKNGWNSIHFAAKQNFSVYTSFMNSFHSFFYLIKDDICDTCV